MAKAVATCKCEKCGNEFDVVTFKRNRREADSFVEWAEANITVCRECERAEQHADALEASEGMPELTGSEKQIAWAIDIRARLTREAETDHFSSKHLALCWKHVVASKTEARFWIDHRNESAEFIVRRLLEKEPEIFEAATETAEEIKADAYAELDAIGKSATIHGKQDRFEQTKEVRKFLDDVFADPRMTPSLIIRKFAVFSGQVSAINVRGTVNASLRDGKVWDSASKQWIDRPEVPDEDVTTDDIVELLVNNDMVEFREQGVVLHVFIDKTTHLLPSIQHPDRAEDFDEFLAYSDLGLPDGCTTEDVYDSLDPRFCEPLAEAVRRIAGRINALRTYLRNRKE